MRSAKYSVRALFYIGLFLGLNAAAVGLYFLLKSFPLLNFNAEMLSVICAGCFLLLFFQSLAAIVSFYKSSDSKILLPMPLTQNELFFSKIIALYLSQLISRLMVMYPFLLWFGLSSQITTAFSQFTYIDMTFYVAMPFMVFLIPAIAVLAAALVSVPVELLKALLKKHTAVNIIVLTVLICGALSVYVYAVIRFSGNIKQGEQLFETMGRVNGAFTQINKHLLFFRLIAALAVRQHFYLVPIVLLLACGGLIAALFFLVKPLYFRLAGQGLESVVLFGGNKGDKQMGTFNALLRREFRIVFRSSDKIISYHLFTIMMPLVMAVYILLFNKLTVNKQGQDIVAGSYFMIICVLTVLSNIYSANIVSIEGKQISFFKTLPVSCRTSLTAKAVFNITVTLVALTVSTLLCIALNPANFSDYLFAYLNASVLGAGTVFLFALLDINFPARMQGAGKARNTAIATLAAMVIGVGLCCVHIALSGKLNGAALWLTDLMVIGFIAAASTITFFVTAESSLMRKQL